MKLLIVFALLSATNVILSTFRSIITIKGNKTTASIVNGIYFSFYNFVLIYTVADFPMWEKCVITFICNVIGVWIVKYIEERLRKDKLWKVEVTVPNDQVEQLLIDCEYFHIEHFNYIDAYQYKVFNFYCATQAENRLIKNVLTEYDVKYFVTESKVL